MSLVETDRLATYQDVIDAPPTMVESADFVCEVHSPSTRHTDLDVKRGLYHRAGIGHLWFVDPLARTLELLRGGGADWTRVALEEGDRAAQCEPFADVALALGELWLD